jgi:hypothetical protein
VDRSSLLFARQSETTFADWYADSLTGVIEVRIPWGMLNVLDPSSRLVLRGTKDGDVAGIETDGFRFVIQSYDPEQPSRSGDRLPRGASATSFGVVPVWTWAKWEEPSWYAALKPQFEVMRNTFGAIPNTPANIAGAAPNGVVAPARAARAP